MKFFALMLLLTGTFLAAGCSGPADKDVLQGAWFMVAEEADGKATPMDQINTQNPRLIFEGERYGFKMRGTTVESGSFTVDSSKTPKTITLKPKGSFTDGGTKEGIYDFQEDVFRVCFGELNKEAPTAFATKLNSGHQMQKYKRVPK